MPSISPSSASPSSAEVAASARRASDSRPARVLARTGLTARAVIYILIGWVAILVAVGHSSPEADQQGALQLVARQPFGAVVLWLLGIGFAGYSLWRLSEAAFGVTGEGKGAGPRLKSLARALVYAGFAYLTFQVISGAQSSQTGRQQDWTAKVMHHTGGQWLVGVIGAIVVIVGLALVMEGIRRKFLKYLRTSEMRPPIRRIVEPLGVIGTALRGLIFALAGALVIGAAVTYDPSKAGGIDKALRTLRDQPFGEFLLILAAAGLIIFGVYGLCEARWRRVT